MEPVDIENSDEATPLLPRQQRLPQTAQTAAMPTSIRAALVVAAVFGCVALAFTFLSQGHVAPPPSDSAALWQSDDNADGWYI